MKKELVLTAILQASVCFAGSGVGGGTPPALSDLSLEIMRSEPGSAGVFDNGAGDVGLLAKSELLSTLNVSKLSLQSGGISNGTLTVSDEDFSLLSLRKKPLDAIDVNGRTASYRVEAGETLDQIILKDRRKAVRAAVRQ